MAEVIKSIKATGGDYSTIAGWESDLDNGAVYSAADDAIGELYNEAYSETVTVNQGDTIGLTSITLRAESSNRHDGTAGTGARVVNTTTHRFETINTQTNIEWIEFNMNGGAPVDCVRLQDIADISNCIIHNVSANAGSPMIAISLDSSGETVVKIQNCLAYDINNAGTGGSQAIWMSTIGTVFVDNNTFTDINCTNATSGDATGVDMTDVAGLTVRNNLVTNINSTAGTAACYNVSSPVSATTQTNGSDDATSPETGLRNLTISFEDAASDDYRLASGDTGAIDAGTDLGAGKIATDLLGRDRDAQGDVWDLGAFEFVAAASVGQWMPIASYG